MATTPDNEYASAIYKNQGSDMAKMWMIRGESGRLYDDFREQGVAAIGWSQLVPLAKLRQNSQPKLTA